MFSDLIENSNRIAPHLLALHESKELYSLARDRSMQSRSKLSDIVSDLIEEALSENERDLVADILIDLTRQAVTDIRQTLSKKISEMPMAPERLVFHLAHDQIEVASHVLEKSTVLSNDDLLYIVESKTSKYWQCIAKRKELSDDIINALADTRDIETHCNLAKNNYIYLTLHAYEAMEVVAKGSEKLAIPLLTRPDVPRDLALRLYEHVGKSLQLYIKEKFDISLTNKVVRESINEVAQKQQTWIPDKENFKDLIYRTKQHEVRQKDIIESLRKGEMQLFVAQFSVFAKLNVETIINTLKEKNGRILACLCHEKEIHRSDFVAIFLMTHKIRNPDRIVGLDDIQSAMKYYDNIKPETARQIMNSIRKGTNVF